MSNIDNFLDGDTSKPGASQIDNFLGDSQPPARGFKGLGKDIAATAVKGAIGVPETLVGLADIPTGGAVGKFLENEGGTVGFRPKQAKELVNDWHSDATKAAQQKFQNADGFVDKTVTAIQNPSLIATAVGESLPLMGLGGVASRGLMMAGARGVSAAAGGVGPSLPGALARTVGEKAAPIVAGGLGEGITMAGSAAEQIRQETPDGRLTPTQSGLALATGALGTAFGIGGGKLASRLGVGDVDTMIAQGSKGMAREFADDAAGAAAKAAANPLVDTAEHSALRSIPASIIKGAISEGFLEELPQSVAEQVLQNIALGKDWSKDVDAAAVMGVLSGGAMGGAAAGFHGYSRPEQTAAGATSTPSSTANATGANQPTTSPGLDRVRQAYAAQLQALQDQEQGDPSVPQTTPPDGAAVLAQQRAQKQAELDAVAAANRAVASPDDEIFQSTGANEPAPVRPSVAMGLDPAKGSLTAGAAIAVDSDAAGQMQQAAAMAQAPAANQSQELDPQTQQSLRDELQASQDPKANTQAPDNAFAYTQEDPGPVAQNIDVQGAVQTKPTPTTPPAQNEGSASPSSDAATGAAQSWQQRNASADSAQAGAPALAVPPTQQPTANVTQAPEAQQSSPQQAQAGTAPATNQGLSNATTPSNNGTQAQSPAGAPAQAETPEQRAQRVVAAGKSWDAMGPDQRKTVMDGSGARSIAKLESSTWERLGTATRESLADAMRPSPAPVSVQTAKVSPSIEVANAAGIATSVLGEDADAKNRFADFADSNSGKSAREVKALLSISEFGPKLSTSELDQISDQISKSGGGVASQARANAVGKVEASSSEKLAYKIRIQKLRVEQAIEAVANARDIDKFGLPIDNGPKKMAAKARLQKAEADLAELESSAKTETTAAPATQAQAPAVDPADNPQSAVTPAKTGKKPSVKDGLKAFREARAEYFTPGNVLPSYGGTFDRVVSYTPPDSKGDWSAEVQEVEPDGNGGYREKMGAPVRVHSTNPSEKELNSGPKYRAPAAPVEVPAQPDQAAVPTGDAAVETPVESKQAAPEGKKASDHLGVNSQPISEGGKPFKTRETAKKEKNKHPTLRVVKVKDGFVLAPKTALQLAADEAKSKRLSQPNTSPAGEPIPAHAFIAASGSLNKSTRNDLGIGDNPRIGNRTLFAASGGLSIEQATEKLIAEQYLPEGASHNDAYALIRKSLTTPQYNSDGIERIAQAEQLARYGDYLAAQEEDSQADPFDSLDALDLTEDDAHTSGYDESSDPIKMEVNALLAQADALGIDTETIKEEAHEATRNGSEQDYFEAQRSQLQAAIRQGDGSRSNQADAGANPEQGREAAVNQGRADRGQDAGQQGSTAEPVLTSPTREEIEAKQDRADAEAKRNESQRLAAEMSAADDENRKRIAKLSEAASSTFTLGGDAMDNLTGQKSVFDAPTVEEVNSEKKTAETDQFAGNKMFTADKVAAARARMKSKLGRLNSGLDPELLVDGMTIAGAYIESGVRSFAKYAKAMVDDMGDGVKPYLLSFWEGARNYPGLDTTGMTSVDESAQLHKYMITPEVKEQASDALGEIITKPAKRTKKTGASADMTLTQDWGVEHIDGYDGTSGRETGSATKDSFLKEAKTYLGQVAESLVEAGFQPHLDRKGNPEKPVSVSEGGIAVSGDASLTMQHPESGTKVFIKIGGSSLRGVVPTTESGVAIMFRSSTGTDRFASGGVNQWAPVNLSARDMATLAANGTRATIEAQSKNQPQEPNNATRQLDRASESPLGGTPAQDVRTPDARGDAGSSTGGGSRGNVASDERTAKAGGDLGAGMGGNTAAVPVSTGGSRTVTTGAKKPRVSRTSGVGKGVGEPGRSGGITPESGANPAPNAPPIAAPQPLAQDFTITDELALGEGGQKTKFKNNVAAIRLMQELESSGRTATPEEQAVLAKYVGWGGLPQAFDPSNADWSKEHAEITALMSPDDLAAARKSTRYAHYTSREIIQDGIYAALRRFGFTGGKTLEAGAGVGNFIGLMPADMRSAGRFTAIEREPFSSAIARQLYPQQSVQRADFTEFKASDSYFDAAVGNPPFASDAQTDRSGRKHLSGLSLHNYFFAKSIDMLREGGIMAQVVTNSFMDAKGDRARQYMGNRVEFLGAIRLPNNAFSKNAGTEVTTDIIFLRKRPEGEFGGKAARADAKRWMDTGIYTDKRGKQVALNQYFIDNPDMMLGDFGAYGSMYGPDQAALMARPGQDTLAMLKAAVEKLPAGVYKSIAETVTAEQTNAAVVALKNPSVKEGGYFVEGGKLMQRLPDIAGEARGVEITPATQWTAKTALGDAGFDRIKSLSNMRATVRSLLAAEMSDDTQAMQSLRATLNEQYDAYRSTHGLINDRATLRVFEDDPDFPLLASLEHGYTPGINVPTAKKMGVKPTKSTAKKGPIFTQRVVAARQAVQKVDTPSDALAVSMAERGKLDASYIGQLLGMEPDDVLKELSAGNKPLLFRDPLTNEYVLRDAYLSGNVRAKLTQAREAGMFINSNELEAVQPKDVSSHEITARIGSPWIPTEVYSDFAKILYGDDVKVSVSYLPANSSFQVFVTGASAASMNVTWGTQEYQGDALLQALMNNRTIKVTGRDSDGKTYTDVPATEKANEKAQQIREKFNDWLFADSDRSEVLTKAYNETNNNYVTRVYDGSNMDFPGKVPDSIIKFRRHQRNAIARIVQDRTALLDHVVGAGKTFTVIAGAMELKRTGLARKPMVAVPNHLVKQWAADFYRLYPGANVLTATKKDFASGNRRKFLAQIATGDWDAVVIAHSSFGFIKPSPEFEAEFNGREIAKIMATIKNVEDGDGEEKSKKRTVKQLEGMKERLENRIRSLRDKPMDDLLDFEQIGVDQLFVDEAHLFKNLMYSTKMQGVSGLNDPSGSQRAYDMYVKTNQVMEKNGRGQGVVFATGTPVSNSLAEMYHMMRYLMPSQMKELGFESFDAWANTFASVEQVWMQAPSGDGFKAQNRMSNFVNTPELLKMFDQVSDTVTMDDIKKAYSEENDGAEFPLPKLKGGRRTPVSLEKSAAQNAYMNEIAQRAKAIEQRKGPPQKGDDNILVVMGDARKAAMDIRLVDSDITAREKGGRIDLATDAVVDRYKKYNSVKGTQLVFSDLGTPLKHAKKELAEYEALQARIQAGTEDVATSAALGNESAMEVMDDSEKAQSELDAMGQDWLGAVKAALRGFSVYDDFKAALIEKGVPEEEIAFIHDFNTDDQKATLFRKVNAGQIRVLLGSTSKLGAGTNVQERLVALHHLDVPWRPSDVEQREGRIERQGNRLMSELPNFEIEILAYVTKDTLDMRMWQVQETKLKMINQLRTRKIGREIDNAFEDMELSAGEMQAAATGDINLLKEIQLRNEVKKLEQRRRAFDGQRNDLISKKRRNAELLASLPEKLRKAEAEASQINAYFSDLEKNKPPFKMNIDGKDYTDALEAQTVLREMDDATYEVKDLAGEVTKKKMPLSVTIDGELIKNRATMAELLSNARGDKYPIAWGFNGQTYRRRTVLANAIREKVQDALADENIQQVGIIGAYEVAVEGGTGRDNSKILEVAMSLDGEVAMSSTITVTDSGAAPTKVIDLVENLMASEVSKANYLARSLDREQKDAVDLAKMDIDGQWPLQQKLDDARNAHKDILAKLNQKDQPQGVSESGEDSPAMSRSRPLREFTKTAMTQASKAVEATVRSLTSGMENAPNVVVAFDMNDSAIPDAVRRADKKQRSGGATGTPEGFFHNGTVYLIASKLKTTDDVARVFAHEALGHYGLRGVFGDGLKPILQQIATMRKAEVDAKIKEYGLRGVNSVDRLTAAEEVLAEMAQKTPTIGFVTRTIAAIRTWLRANVMGLSALRLSDAEIIRSYILPARGWVERGVNADAGAVQAAFSRGKNDAMTNSNVVGNQGGRSADDSTPGPVYKDDMPPERDGFVRLYHGGTDPEHGYFTKVPDEYTSSNVFDGFFASTDDMAWGAHGTGGDYFADISENKILSSDTLKYEIPDEDSIDAMKSAMHWLNDEDVDLAYDAVIKDRSHKLDSDDLQRIFRSDNDGEASWEAQRIRGNVAKKLGYDAVEMDDEHGTSYLIVQGVPITRAFSRNESPAPTRDGAQPMFSREDQTKTEAFKRWFGDSKVVDEDGKPLVVYHGSTSSKLDSINPGYREPGAWFTRDIQYANDYSKGPDGEIYSVFLRMSKPMVVTFNGRMNPIVDGEKILDKYDDPIDNNVEIVKYAMSNGYDGVIFPDGNFSEDSSAWVVFKPNQIKSSTENNGEFDTENDGIRFSRSSIQGLKSSALDQINRRETVIAGETGRTYTTEQQAAMRNVGFMVERPSLKERAQALWQDAGKKMAQGIVDQFAPVKEISKDAYALLRLSKGSSGAFETLLKGGKLKLSDGVYDFDDANKGGVVDVLLTPLNGEHHDFLRWVAANRAERLMGEDREHLFTKEDIAALKTLTDGDLSFDFTLKNGIRKGQTTRSRAEAYRDSLATFNAFNKNVMDMAEQSGLIDPESRATWESEFYVPFYRVADEESGGVRGMNIKGSVVRQQAFKHLKGGKQALNNDLLDNTLMNWAHLLDASAKNRAAKATLEAAAQVGAAIEAPRYTLDQIGSSIGKKNGMVWFMDEGKKRHFMVDDPYLLTAVSSLEYAGMNSPIMNALGSFKHALTIGVTASPFFKVRNLIRDSIQVIGSGPIGYNPAKNIAQGWKLTDPKADAYFKLLAGGGTIHFGTMLEGSESKRIQALVESGVDESTILNNDQKVKAFFRKFIEPGISAYNELGNRGEAVNRAALYDQLVKQGKSHAEASLMARDLMDFSMQGSFTTVRFLSQVVPFFNARLQGMYKLGRAAKEDPKRMAYVTGAVAMASLALMAGYGGDDDWKKREDWDRNNFWWFKFGDMAFRIPKPFEIGAIGTLAERSAEYLMDDEMTGKRFRDQVLALLGDNLSMNPIPQAVKPIMDVYANKDSFKGTPIENMGMERLKSEYRFNDRTSMTARATSTALNSVTGLVGKEALSPVQVDHLIRGYFGWLGTFAVSTADTIARTATSQPVQATPDYWRIATGNMVSDLRDAPSRYVSSMYDQSKALEQAYGTWHALRKSGKTEEAAQFLDENRNEITRYPGVQHIKTIEGKMNERIRQIEQSNMDPDAKREAIRSIRVQKEGVAKSLAGAT